MKGKMRKKENKTGREMNKKIKKMRENRMKDVKQKKIM